MKPEPEPDATASRAYEESADTSPPEPTHVGADVPSSTVLLANSFGPPKVPTEVGTLGRFRIIQELGRGGMGAVYLAFDERLHRKIALKVMLPTAAANASAKERFLREARAAGNINHDHIIPILDADEINGVPFIALPFLQGYPLDQYLRKKGNPELQQSLQIGREIAIGLQAAHDLGIVHRDIKPGNIWLEAPNGRVKILDFGLAKPTGLEDGGKELTRSGAIMGTPAYMAPEQGAGLKVDFRADLFSLGAVLYRLVTGRLPFDGETVMAILTALAVKEPRPVQELNPGVPDALADLIWQLLRKDPADRPASAADVAKRLAAIQNGETASTGRPVLGKPLVYVPMQVTALDQPNAFEGLDDSVTEVQHKPAAPPVEVAPIKSSWLVASLLGGLSLLLAAGFVIYKLARPTPEVVQTVPDEPKPSPKKVEPKPIPSGPQPLVALADVKPQPPRAAKSPYDDLDAAQIPANERYPWQPKELVAVVGSSKGHVGSTATAWVQFSPDNRWIVRADDDGVAILDAATLRPMFVDTRPSARTCAFTPDSKYVAVANNTPGARTVRLIDLTKPEPAFVRDIAWPASNVASILFVPNKNLTAVGTASGGLELWDFTNTTKKPTTKIADDRPGFGTTRWITTSADGNRLASVCEVPPNKMYVTVRDLSGPNPAIITHIIHNWTTETEAVLTADGTKIYVRADRDEKDKSDILRLYEVGAEKKILARETMGFHQIVGLRPDGMGVYTIDKDNGVQTWTFANGKLTKAKTINLKHARAVSPDGTRIATASGNDPRLNIYDADGQMVIGATNPAVDGLRTPVMAADALFTSANVRPWLVKDGRFIPGPVDAEVAAALQKWNFYYASPSPDGKRVAGNGPDASAKVVGVSATGISKPIDLKHQGGNANPANSMICIAWGPDSRTVFSAERDGSLTRWDATNPDTPPVRLWAGGSDVIEPHALVVHPSGRLLADIPKAGNIRLTILGEKPSQRIIPRTGIEFRSLAFTPDGRYLLAANNNLRRYDLTKPDLPGEDVIEGDVYEFWLSPDGRSILVRTLKNKNQYEWWDAQTFKRRGSWQLPWNFVTANPFAPDSRHLVFEQMGCAYVLRLEPPPAADADRMAAEFVTTRSVGGKVVIDPEAHIYNLANLPKSSFKVKACYFTDKARVTDNDLHLFRPLDAVETVHLAGPISNAGLATLADTPMSRSVTTFWLTGSTVTDDGLKPITTFANLTHFGLVDAPNVTGAGLSYLKRSKVQRVWLDRVPVADLHLGILMACPDLKELTVMSAPIGDQAMVRIGQLSGLTTLQLLNVAVSDEGVKHLQKLMALSNLHFSTTQPIGKIWETIGRLTSLHRLSIGNAPPNGDADVKLLLPLTKLNHLKIDTDFLTDAGLATLAEMKSLRILDLSSCPKVTDVAIKAFEIAMPGCKVTPPTRK